MDDKLLKYFLKIQPLLENEIETINGTMGVKHFKKALFYQKKGKLQLKPILF